MDSKRLAQLDRLSLLGIALSFFIILQPFWKYGFKTGLLMLIIFTSAQLIIRYLLPAKG